MLWEVRTFLRGFSLPVPTAVQVGPFLLRRFEPPWAVECAASLADVECPRHHGRRNVEDRPAGYGRPFRIRSEHLMIDRIDLQNKKNT